jgi:hypothetical protein
MAVMVKSQASKPALAHSSTAFSSPTRLAADSISVEISIARNPPFPGYYRGVLYYNWSDYTIIFSKKDIEKQKVYKKVCDLYKREYCGEISPMV